MAKGGSGDTQTTTTVQTPWSGSQPHLQTIMSEAQKLYKSNIPEYYGGSTVAGFTPETDASQRGIVARATSGSPLNSSASGYLQNVLSGNYLNSNPEFKAVSDSVAREVIPRVSGQFAGSGRYGGGLNQTSMVDALTAGIAPFAFQNYGQERDRQQQAVGMAPQLAGQDYLDLGMLGQVGAERQGMNQALIDADIARYNFEQQKPFSKLTDYLSYVQGGGAGYGTTTQTSPYQGPNTFQQILSGGLGLGSLASLFFP